MEIVYTGSIRIRIEGYGYVTPGRSITVPDDIGRQLCVKGRAFKEVKNSLPLPEIEKPLQEVKKPVKKSTRKSRKKK